MAPIYSVSSKLIVQVRDLEGRTLEIPEMGTGQILLLCKILQCPCHTGWCQYPTTSVLISHKWDTKEKNTSISGMVEPMLEAMAISIWEARDLEWDQDWVVACFGLGVDLLQGFKAEAG